MLCEFCGNPIKSMPYKCKFCDCHFCDEHRLPEAHKCSNLHIIHSDGKWFPDSEDPERKISDLERENVRLQEIVLGFTQDSSMSRNDARILLEKNTFLINKLKDRRRNY